MSQPPNQPPGGQWRPVSGGNDSGGSQNPFAQNSGWQQNPGDQNQYGQGQNQYGQGQGQYRQGQGQYGQDPFAQNGGQGFPPGGGGGFPPQNGGQGGPQQPFGPGAGAGAAAATKAAGVSTPIKILIGVVALLLVGGVVVGVTDPLGWRTSKSAAAEAVPADAVFYSELNLDQGTGQQLEMLRFALKFPSVREKFNLSEQQDLKKNLVEAYLKEADCQGDYEQDFKPWLGDHFASALRPGKSTALAYFEVTDESAAKKAMDKLKPCLKGHAVAFGKNHLVMAENQADADDAVNAAKNDSLSKQKQFNDDLAKVGSLGIASFWANGAGMSQVQQQGGRVGAGSSSDPKLGDHLTGVAGTLRFSGGNPELRIRSQAVDALPKPGAVSSAVGDLPADTTVALGISGGRQLVPQIMKSMTPEQTQRLTNSGLKLPGDLETLLGDDFVLSAGTLDMSRVSASTLTKLPVGISVKTDRARLDSLVAPWKNLGLPLLTTGADPTRITLSQAYADQLQNPGQKLKDQADFTDAVPNWKDAHQTVYVNLSSYSNQLGQLTSPENARDVQALKSIGLSNHQVDEHVNETTIRLVAR